MLDLFVVFSKTGLVLFKQELVKIKNSDPIDGLIRTVLLEGRATTEQQYVDGQNAVKWVVGNYDNFEIVFAAVYQTMLVPRYVDDLLELVSKNFVKVYKDSIPDAGGLLDYEERFNRLLEQAEDKATHRRKGGNSPSPKRKSKNTEVTKEDETCNVDDDVQRMHDRLAARRERASKPGKSSSRSPKRTSGKPGKEMRTWGDKKKLTKEEAAALDVTGASATLSSEKLEETELKRAQVYMPDSDDELADIDKEDSDDDDDSSWTFSALSNFMANLTGQKPLTREDLSPTIDEMEKKLLSKNVSTVAAREICQAVMQDLEGKKLGSFTRGIATAVRESCHAALLRLLTPKGSIDILREARAARDEGRTYSIVMLGVNGVGKSTSLSKIAYYLKQNGLKVMLVACDTFRSGAVEQLKVHSRNLKIPLFEQGYNKDASSVAVYGVKHAKEEGIDVVLIDTAGRMQNNEPLMRSLTKLVAKNRPDKVLFVGEALVGNDGTDQLVHFDKALRDYSDSPDPRTIDGMVLTKFDTIDDKVGAAVSMVHSTGQPIIFVGTGQKYTNLNRLNINKVLKSLLS